VSSALDKIIEDVRALSPEEQQQLRELLDRETQNSEQAKRLSLSSTIRGKYRDVLNSSEEFIARKAAETVREDRAQ
jgi:hypothetical protein